MERPWEELITEARVIDLHREAMEGEGQQPTQPEPGCIDRSLGAAQSAEYYREETDTSIPGLAFAGYALFYLTKNHCFLDGNKRVGWLVAVAVLLEIGLTLQVTDDDAEQMVQNVATGAIASGAEVVLWFHDNLTSAELGS